MEIKTFENSLIAFDFENETINATDLLRHYNEKRPDNENEKRMDNFLRSQGIKAFITELESDAQKSAPDFQAITQSINEYGKSSGTWINRLLAYRLAAWLSPKVELFIYKTFDEVINTRIKYLQMQNDRLWDKSDQSDLYGNMKKL